MSDAPKPPYLSRSGYQPKVSPSDRPPMPPIEEFKARFSERPPPSPASPRPPTGEYRITHAPVSEPLMVREQVALAVLLKLIETHGPAAVPTIETYTEMAFAAADTFQERR